jgi:hypothetical protein
MHSEHSTTAWHFDSRLPSSTVVFVLLIGSHFGEGALFTEDGERGCDVAVAKNAENKKVLAMGLDRQVHKELQDKFPEYAEYFETVFGAKLKERIAKIENRDQNRDRTAKKKAAKHAGTKEQAILARGDTVWNIGDKVEITKAGSHIGKTAVVTEPNWEGRVKVRMDGKGAPIIKSYLANEVRLSSPDGGGEGLSLYRD